MALVFADSPAGLAWGSSTPGAPLPLEWGAPSAITAARGLPWEWGESVPGAPAPLEWGAAERIEAARLPLAGLRRTEGAVLSAPAEIVIRRIAAADAAVPAESRAQTRVDGSLPAAALSATARTLGTPSEATGSAAFISDRVLPIEALSTSTAAAGPLPAELGGGTASALLPRIETLLRQLGSVALAVEVLRAGRGARGAAAAGSLAGIRGGGAAWPEFLAAMLLDPSVAGEFSALPDAVAAMRTETLLALLREATVPTGAAAGSGSVVGAKAFLPIVWRRRKRIRIRRLLASPGRRRVLGPVGTDSGS